MLILAIAFALAATPERARGADPPADKPSFNRHTGLFEPPLDELERSFERGDRAEVARWAERIGPARLSGLLRGSDRGFVVAGLAAAAALRGSARLLEAATPIASSADPALAENAVRALGTMLDGSDPRSLEEWDIPRDTVARACRALVDAATRAGSAQTVRLAALDALTESSAFCPAAALGRLLSDTTPAVRRAAVMALRPRDNLTIPELQKAIADSDSGVVSAAAVAWCRHRLVLPAATALATSMLPLLRALALSESTTVEDAVEVMPCLAGSSDPADRKAIEQLKRSKVPLLRTRAEELGGGASR
jgi:hypothetical protein